MPSTSRADVTAVILTFNEERNLTACLESLVDWVAQVFVVDSGSTDRTVAIAEQLGATVVTHPFESHAHQWNWALATLPLASEWVLALDADQLVTFEPRGHARSLATRTAPALRSAGISMAQFFAASDCHGGYYPSTPRCSGTA